MCLHVSNLDAMREWPASRSVLSFRAFSLRMFLIQTTEFCGIWKYPTCCLERALNSAWDVRMGRDLLMKTQSSGGFFRVDSILMHSTEVAHFTETN